MLVPGSYSCSPFVTSLVYFQIYVDDVKTAIAAQLKIFPVVEFESPFDKERYPSGRISVFPSCMAFQLTDPGLQTLLYKFIRKAHGFGILL